MLTQVVSECTDGSYSDGCIVRPGNQGGIGGGGIDWQGMYDVGEDYDYAPKNDCAVEQDKGNILFKRERRVNECYGSICEYVDRCEKILP